VPRLFTGIKVPVEIAQILACKRGKLNGARWVSMEDYHITLRFLGDVGDDVAEEVAFQLARMKHSRFRVCLNGLDVFGARKPRTLFACVRFNEDLWALQGKHEQIMQRAGLAPETRKYAPHVTLARLKGVKPGEVAGFLGCHGGFTPMEFDIQEFVLFSARNSIGGGPYVIEEGYRL
jgi:2'-5' RNA ligase